MTENVKKLTAGEMLKHARTTGRRKRELATIAKQLCIKEEFLDALESGDYKKIPELIYTLGFARNYAIELELDPVEIVSKIKEEMGIVSEEEKFEKEINEKSENKKICELETIEKIRTLMRKNWKWVSTIIVSVIVILLAIWGVSKFIANHGNKTEVEQIALYTPKFNLPVKEEFGIENKATANIALQATQESWIKIEDAQGETIFSRVLVPGEVYYVPVSNVKGTFGNAGGIDIWVNGVLAPQLGAPHVRKADIVMTPETLMPQM